ncbi:MAG: hypothetical protein ACI4MI_03805 [Christensenellales bacterium]
MLEEILPLAIYNELLERNWTDNLTEIRIRAGKPIYCAVGGRYVRMGEKDSYIATQNDVEYVVDKACSSSLYAYDDCITQGYVSTHDGIRIGIAGEGVVKSGKLCAVKNFKYLCIRIPHDVQVFCPKVQRVLQDFDNTIIFSKPGLGKTTLLRYMIRRLSDNGNNVLVIDERMELSGDSYDLGECSDVVCGIPKSEVYANYIKSMRPDVVATDEIFSSVEVGCILDCIRSGVKVIATVHADNLDVLLGDKIYGALLDRFRYFIRIDKIGSVDKVYDKEITDV